MCKCLQDQNLPVCAQHVITEQSTAARASVPPPPHSDPQRTATRGTLGSLPPRAAFQQPTDGTHRSEPRNPLGWRRPPRSPRPTIRHARRASRWAARTGRGSSVILASTFLEKLILAHEDLLEKTKILMTPPINYKDFNGSSHPLPSPGGSGTRQRSQVRKDSCAFCSFHHRRAFCASYRSAAGEVREGTAPRKRQRLRTVSSATKLCRTAPEFT